MKVLMLFTHIPGGSAERLVHNGPQRPRQKRPGGHAGHCVLGALRAPFPEGEERQDTDRGHGAVRRHLR